jgi:hypothetical protein
MLGTSPFRQLKRYSVNLADFTLQQAEMEFVVRSTTAASSHNSNSNNVVLMYTPKSYYCFCALPYFIDKSHVTM